MSQMRQLMDETPADGQRCTIWTREIGFAEATYRRQTAENMGPVWELGANQMPVPVLSRDHWEPTTPVCPRCGKEIRVKESSNSTLRVEHSVSQSEVESAWRDVHIPGGGA